MVICVGILQRRNANKGTRKKEYGNNCIKKESTGLNSKQHFCMQE